MVCFVYKKIVDGSCIVITNNSHYNYSSTFDRILLTIITCYGYRIM